MNVITRAIEKGWHIADREKAEAQDWDVFERCYAGKKLFLFGVGDGASYFLANYGKKYRIAGVIDNDRKKQGSYLKNFLDHPDDAAYDRMKIMALSDLEGYAREEIIILITSLKYHREIANQLEGSKFLTYFALLPMEGKRHGGESDQDNDIGKLLERYQKEPIDTDKIIFYTMGSYSGHGKAIAEELLRLRSDLDIVWITDDPVTDTPEGIRTIYQKNQQKYLYEMATARMWIWETLIPEYINKRPEQIYIQLKHWSSITLKSFVLKMFEFRNYQPGIELALHNADMMDYLLVGSDFDERTCREGFGFQGKMIRVGSPRSDVLFRGRDVRNKVAAYYSLKAEDKYVLYAPTFRYKNDMDEIHEAYCADLDFEELCSALSRRFGGRWRVLLRLHPSVAVAQNDMVFPECVIPVSDYEDSQELVAAADMVITDYSSLMFEPAFAGKPVFLYAPDRREFIDGERELLIDYDTLPFPMAESNEELMENVKAFDQASYERRVQAFLDSYGVHEDGHAAERAVAFIAGLIPEKEKYGTEIG